MRYAFIGLGNMAGAIIRGMAACGKFTEDTITGYDLAEDKLRAMAADWGVIPASGIPSAAAGADVLVLAVKPQHMEPVLAEAAPHLTPGAQVITIAAGLKLAWYEARLPAATPVVRVMPNLNAVARAAVSALCPGTWAGETELRRAEKLFSAVGSTFRLSEDQFHAFVGISGSSPAFTYMYTAALAQAGAERGLPEDLALQIACAAVAGSATMLAQSGTDPQELVRRVCSPGGTTIEGVNLLREREFEAAARDAALAAADKDRRMGGD